jgi:hypothetical protein
MFGLLTLPLGGRSPLFTVGPLTEGQLDTQLCWAVARLAAQLCWVCPLVEAQGPHSFVKWDTSIQGAPLVEDQLATQLCWGL